MADAAWLGGFPMLAALPDNEVAPLLAAAMPALLPAGAAVFSPGQPCSHFILLRRGTLRAYQIGEDGGEIVLYRLGPGGPCILTMLALLGADRHAAFAVAETDIAAIAIPVGVFNDMLGRSAGFRRFVFAAHAERMADLMRVIQHVAFESIDTRLAARLLALAGPGGDLAITHQQLAAEIGSAREVVSRHLKLFERRGWVALGRGTVCLLRRDALGAAAAHADM